MKVEKNKLHSKSYDGLSSKRIKCDLTQEMLDDIKKMKPFDGSIEEELVKTLKLEKRKDKIKKILKNK